MEEEVLTPKNEESEEGDDTMHKIQRLEKANAALRATILGMEAQVVSSNEGAEAKAAALKEEMAHRERLQNEWNSRKTALEESTRAALRQAEEALEKEGRQRALAQEQIAEALPSRIPTQCLSTSTLMLALALTLILILIEGQGSNKSRRGST